MSSASSPNPARRTNRLAASSSPYLLQHQCNPVDWWEWGPEAFAEARRRDVPIFLSVGYSTCYWCHVMERECFESESIAAQMNRDFVCIKVDREERPDVDDVYMAAVQAFSGRGGWPMSVFLEPQSLRPFWAGTYFPAEPKFTGVPTLPNVLSAMHKAWREQRDEVLSQARELADAVRERVASTPDAVALDHRIVQHAAAQLLKIHDRTNGGFGAAPKFPQPVFLDLLMETRAAAGDDDTRAAIDAALRSTLDAMALGGAFDQVGGGFHRYSVDERWTVPHFEKMLYDNGQLLGVYARAAAMYQDAFYGGVARRIVAYVQRELLAPCGAFFAAQDAEVNHREGQNYVWTQAEFERVLGPADAAWGASAYGLDRAPNFQDPHHPGDTPTNVLRLAARPEVIAATSGMSASDVQHRLQRLNAVLLKHRDKRPQPSTDTKIIAGWNAIVIAGLADAALHAGVPEALPLAARALEFVLSRMRTPTGELLRCWAAGPDIDGAAHTPAFLEDYALLIRACLALHRAQQRLGASVVPDALGTAVDLLRHAEQQFGAEGAGFFDTRPDQPDLFVRARSMHDGAIPSGSSVMAMNLLELADATGDAAYLSRAASALRAVSGVMAQAPLGAAESVRAFLGLMRRDAALSRSTFAGAAHPAPEAAEIDAPDPVEVFAEGDAIELAPGQAATIMLRLKIAPGYHITAADPGDSGAARSLLPLRVHVVGGSGLRVYADYPAGEPLNSGEQRILVHHGEVDLQAVVEREGDWSGTPLLAVTYQACTDRACLSPRTVELDVSVERA